MSSQAKRKKKRTAGWWVGRALIVLLIAGLTVSLAAFSVNAYVVKRGQAAVVSPETAADYGADCILVLGAGVEGSTLSPMLEDRVKTGIALYWSGAGQKLLMSGDHGRVDYDEVSAMKQYAMQAGVPEEDIFLDHAGFSTYESVYRAQAVFGVRNMVVVTQEYHLYRALYVAQSLGVDAMGVSASLQLYAGQAARDVREFFARDKEAVACIVKPLPTYLGDPIDIHGDGKVTE